MTISNTSRTAGPFIGDGIAASFPFSYKVFARGDVLVARTVTATQVETMLVLDADYTITLNPNQNSSPGGVITLSMPLAIGTSLAATSNLAIQQSLDLTNNGGFYPTVINDALDRIVITIQQLSAKVGAGALNVGSAATIANILNTLVTLAAGGGAALVGYLQSGTGAVLRTVKARLLGRVSPEDFGAVNDGTTDCGPAFRRALDSMPVWGGVVECETAGPYLVIGTVFIPQRASVFGRGGIRLKGRNSSIIGNGSNTIFESGTGQFSTVSRGGASNFGQPNESTASIHTNSSIEGFNFANCGTPVRLYNWLQGCKVSDLYATGFTTMLDIERCFYMGFSNIQGRPLQDGRLDATPIFRFKGANNTMAFHNVHASGITSGGLSKGTGWEFDGGVQGIELPAGCSSEGCVYGVVLKSFIYSMAINGFYFELNTTAIKSVGANLFGLSVDYCDFDNCAKNMDVDFWTGGFFGASNNSRGAGGAMILGSGCTNEVYLPSQTLSELTHTNWVPAPANWNINAGCQIVRNDMIYNSDNGYSSPLFRNAPASSGGGGVVPLNYTGTCFNAGGTIPYCTVTGVGTATLVVTTKITYSANLSAVRFDLLVAHSQNDVIAGVLSANGMIFRDDAVAGVTVTASNSGGFVRLTFAGFVGITSFSGKVRVV